jgi:hypothetical protein
VVSGQVTLRMCAMKALVIPSLSCCIVWIEGVGDEDEYSKNCCILFDFQMKLAVWRIPIGKGCIVEIVNIFRSFGWC